jgi:N-methylhydantoinase A
MKRIGIDIGGTFTDIVVFHEHSGSVERSKTPTTPHAPEEGFLRALADQGITVDDVSYFMHATTLVTNLIIERAGAKVGLITTKGFRDVLEIQRSYRKDLYDLQWEKPEPFVPRYLRLEVEERVAPDGQVLKAVDPDEARAVVKELLAEGVSALAVCLFNAYANPVNERTIKTIVSELTPDTYLSLSSEIDPRIREYERVSTTVLNAYAMPRVHRYVDRLSRALGQQKDIKYMHSGGGVVPGRVAQRFPIQLAYSGPAAGALAGRFLAASLGVRNACTMDMGGTSCDICLIRDGEPDTKDTIDVEWGIPARTQSIDINSIGAGGGSIIWVDTGGALRVGPQSAGADPGPVCYGRGGTLPTVTDANLVLGILNPDGLLGGRLRIDRHKAEAALQPIAQYYGTSVDEVARGVYRIVNANMAQAIREVTVKRGVDPRDFTLVPFGGAGGQHAADVAREMGINVALFPRNAAALSAFGLLTADLKNTTTKSLMVKLKQASRDRLEQDFATLEADGRAFLHGEEHAVTHVYTERWADVRYIGQSHEVAVPVEPGEANPEVIYERFEHLHERLYGTRLSDPAEIVNIRVTVTGGVKPLHLPPFQPQETRTAPTAHRQTAFFDEPLPVYWRDGLPPGWECDHSCLIEEVDSVLFLPGGHISVDKYGNVRLDYGSVAGHPQRTRAKEGTV